MLSAALTIRTTQLYSWFSGGLNRKPRRTDNRVSGAAAAVARRRWALVDVRRRQKFCWGRRGGCERRSPLDLASIGSGPAGAVQGSRIAGLLPRPRRGRPLAASFSSLSAPRSNPARIQETRDHVDVARAGRETPHVRGKPSDHQSVLVGIF